MWPPGLNVGPRPGHGVNTALDPIFQHLPGYGTFVALRPVALGFQFRKAPCNTGTDGRAAQSEQTIAARDCRPEGENGLAWSQSCKPDA